MAIHDAQLRKDGPEASDVCELPVETASEAAGSGDTKVYRRKKQFRPCKQKREQLKKVAESMKDEMASHGQSLANTDELNVGDLQTYIPQAIAKSEQMMEKLGKKVGLPIGSKATGTSDGPWTTRCRIQLADVIAEVEVTQDDVIAEVEVTQDDLVRPLEISSMVGDGAAGTAAWEVEEDVNELWQRIRQQLKELIHQEVQAASVQPWMVGRDSTPWKVTPTFRCGF